MKLKDKVVVITGSAQGLGQELAKIFASADAKVVVSDINKSALTKFAKTINALPVVTDVTKESAVTKLANTTIKKYGQIDIWINNAGLWLPHARINDFNMKVVEKMFAVNVFGLMYGSRSALAQMSKQSAGMIVNIISISALEIHLNSAFYCATKTATDGFTKGLRLEVKKYNKDKIKVIAVYPDKIKTKLYEQKKPKDYAKFMEPAVVAKKIVNNIESAKPKNELIIKPR